MATVAEAWFLFLAALVAGQTLLVAIFVVRLCRFRRTLLGDRHCPNAVVILCLRGSDPFLPRCVRSILRQDYPNYALRIVVDQPDDPAALIVREVLAEFPTATVAMEPLAMRRETCSLKCSSVVQVAAHLDQSVEFVAQLDADVVPHATWLRELATALADERIGAATGNRWYMPDDAAWGALVRYFWNAAAVVQMFSYRIAWGGTLAIKTRVIREAGLLDKWSRALCEDTMLFHQLRGAGWQVAFVPTLMMVNRETCDLRGFYVWVRRQLLTARLYHPGWPAVVVHGFGTAVAMVTTIAFGIWSAASSNLTACVWFCAGLLGYQVAMYLLIVPVELAVRRVVRTRGESAQWLSPIKLVRLVAAMTLTQLVYPLALASALLLRRVDWRGVEYSIGGPWAIRLLEYRPFKTTGPADSPVSL